MFGGNKESKENAELANKKNQIEKGTKIIGDIESHGNIRLDGDMVGNVNSQSKVVLGQTCTMEGKLTAKNAEIAGQIKGIIHVSHKLILKATAIVNADVIYGKIEIDDGAIVNGTLKMEGAVLTNTNEKGQNNKKEKSAR
jgi:cytoskeletal protein CcmA (bactofilin family)